VPTAQGAVVVDDTMAASTQQGSTPGILFDDPTFGELEVESDIQERPYPGPAAQQGTELLLVVDPDEESRRRVASVFTERGYRVMEADRGDSALQMVSHYGADVIILEATLPGVHGFEVARQLKFSDRYGDIRIVMTSSHYRGWRIAEDLKTNYRIDGFVEKPYNIGDVVHEVERTRGAATPKAAGTSDAAEPYLNAGIAAYKAGQMAEAISQLRAGTQVDPLAYKIHFHLGLLYGKTGQLYDGIQELETVLSIRSDFFPALKNLAVLYQNAGFRNKAIEMWERCLAAAPDDETRETIKRHLVAVL
jgi:CheY-like chemotaxis protein